MKKYRLYINDGEEMTIYTVETDNIDTILKAAMIDTIEHKIDVRNIKEITIDLTDNNHNSGMIYIDVEENGEYLIYSIWAKEYKPFPEFKPDKNTLRKAANLKTTGRNVFEYDSIRTAPRSLGVVQESLDKLLKQLEL